MKKTKFNQYKKSMGVDYGKYTNLDYGPEYRLKEIMENIDNPDGVFAEDLFYIFDHQPLPEGYGDKTDKLMYKTINAVRRKLFHDAFSIKHSFNKVWGLHGPESMDMHISALILESKKIDKEVVPYIETKSKDSDNWYYDTIETLNRMMQIEKKIIKLRKIQKQSKFVNFFYSRFPVFVR